MTIRDMLAMQKDLQAHYRAIWDEPRPENGQNSLLWAFIELGEMADILKKRGGRAVMDDPEARRDFIEELTDVLMYLGDVCLSYSLDPTEIERIYLEKHSRNMMRWDDRLPEKEET